MPPTNSTGDVSKKIRALAKLASMGEDLEKANEEPSR